MATTVMLVEDNDELREAVCGLLHDHGFRVLSAGNGMEALEQLRAHPEVRAIVLDVEMPLMNGATFRGEQLADPAIAAVPTILITARKDSASLQKALEADGCLKKPFTDEELLGLLKRFC